MSDIDLAICKCLLERAIIKYPGYKTVSNLPGELPGIGKCCNFIIYPPEAEPSPDSVGQYWILDKEWCTQSCLVVVHREWGAVFQSDGKMGWSDDCCWVGWYHPDSIALIEQCIDDIIIGQTWHVGRIPFDYDPES